MEIKATSNKKKGRSRAYGSLIWLVVSLSIMGQLHRANPSITMSSYVFFCFFPLAIAWGIKIIIRLIKQPKGQRSFKSFNIWATLTFWLIIGWYFLWANEI